MNKSQQKQLQRAEALLEEAKLIVEAVRDELQESYDEKSERWQESEKGEEAQEVINNLDILCDEIENASDSTNNITSEFE